MNTSLPRIVFGIVSLLVVAVASKAKDAEWQAVAVPEVWRKPPRGKLASPDGFAWYRCWVKVPESWKGKNLSLYVEPVDDARAVYFNGTQVGVAGTFPPRYRSGLNEPSRHRVPKNLVKPGELNFVALRVYYNDGRTNFNVAAPVLLKGDVAIRMEGNWQATAGDNAAWAAAPAKVADALTFDTVDAVEDVELYVRRRKGDHDPYPPAKALASFEIPDDLKIEQPLSEPEIAQPLFINWDERGRLWVMEYRQYPDPAGLKMVSRDKYLRTVYDKVPPAPPNHFKGRDRISIHEDTNGDGKLDKHKTFVEGLSLATSFARGRGGVWVLNPPYLLFYPDKNNDDVPDGDPVVHLSGFGIEDSHSVVNSLRWGPDGWLFAAQGSTVSAIVKRPGDKVGKRSMGQLIWRYHPESKRYEVFAEGGGNTFGVEIDSKGRVYSGHNGGDTRGFHYVQGGYFRKGFNKHGSLSNPFAFGYFPAMKHHSVPRFTHNFVIYEGATLPRQYHGRLFGVEPLQGQLVQSEVASDGTTFKTKDLDRPVKTTDQWFRPVDVKVGPDGAIYFCDLYEQRIDHSSHYSGRVDRTNGRVYRLQAKDVQPMRPFDYSKLGGPQLVDVLRHENKWHRQTALRLLADRKDKSIVPLLKKRIASEKGQTALEMLWALHVSGGLDDAFASKLLSHDNLYVRLWTVRLICDDRRVSPAVATKLADLAVKESSAHVRSQLACSAKRLPAKDALPVVRGLLTHDEDVGDPHVPLLIWWAVESKAASDRDAVASLFADRKTWQSAIVRQFILERIVRRYALSGTRSDLITCAKILSSAPTQADAKPLLTGFELAFKGRSLPRLPDELLQALAKTGGASLELQVRQGKPDAVKRALSIVVDPKQSASKRIGLIRILGQIDGDDSTPVLLKLVETAKDDAIRKTALTALQTRQDDKIGAVVTALHNRLPDEVRGVAQEMLASRKAWAVQLLQAIDKGGVDKSAIPSTVVRKMLLHADKHLAGLVRKHFGDQQGATTEEMRAEIARLEKIILIGSGNPYKGRDLYKMNCAKCHQLFGAGGEIGPDLTSFQRTDLQRVLLNVVNPSAEIREGFENFAISTEDGRVMNGFLADQDNRVVVLRTPEGENRVVPRDRIVEKRALPTSIMPEGLLKKLTDQQVRDLFAYLRGSQPLP